MLEVIEANSVYRRLPENSTRLLLLHGDAPESQPRLTLTGCPYHEIANHKYTALSYCWGDPSKTRPIHCNGKKLRVTRTLWSGFWHLRSEMPVGTTRSYWIDAICINQSDESEKNVQVPRTGDIYRRAARVLIWVGDRSSSTHTAYLALHEWYSIAKSMFYSDGSVAPLRRAFVEYIEEQGAQMEQKLRAVEDLVQQP